MDQVGLVFPRGNDIVVTARFPDISNGSGINAEFYSKPGRTVADTDLSVQVYNSSLVTDPDNVGATMAQFTIPSIDTGATGAFWWRVDCIDVLSKRRTAACGPLLVEAV